MKILQALPWALVAGLIAAAPSAAEEPMVERSFEQGQITILVPKALKQASEKLVKLKYQGRVPARNILTDEDGAVNLLVRLGPQRLPAEMIPQMANMMRIRIVQRRPGSVIHTSETRTINGHQFAYLEFTSPAIDTKVRNFMMLSVIGGKLSIISFNVTVPRLKRWLPVARRIVASVKAKK